MRIEIKRIMGTPTSGFMLSTTYSNKSYFRSPALTNLVFQYVIGFQRKVDVAFAHPLLTKMTRSIDFYLFFCFLVILLVFGKPFQRSSSKRS